MSENGEKNGIVLPFPKKDQSLQENVDSQQRLLNNQAFYVRVEEKITKGDYQFFEKIDQLPADAEQLGQHERWFFGNIKNRSKGEFDLFRYSGLSWEELEKLEAELAAREKEVKVVEIDFKNKGEANE
ncbi:MAG: hypothetical protein WCT37_01440 [Patescibacteria group bacterium]|jgi:hypothetical protein